MASTANTAAPATVASGACWPGIRKVVAAPSAAHVPKAAAQTPTTSSRLPRWYRLRYSPASRPQAGTSTPTASVTRREKACMTAAGERSRVTHADASMPQIQTIMS